MNLTPLRIAMLVVLVLALLVMLFGHNRTWFDFATALILGLYLVGVL